MNWQRPKVCRICRAPDNDDLISVRLIQDNITIARMVEELTGIQVMLDKNLPQNICLRCLERLRNAHQLRQQCIESDQLLRGELYPEGSVREFPCKSGSNDMVKLEIEALEEELEPEEGLEAMAERVDLDIIVEEAEEGSPAEAVVEQEESKLTAAQELIDILAPEESTGKKHEMVYLNDLDEKDYEVLLERDHYDHIKFTAASCCGCSERFENREDMKGHEMKAALHECPICYERSSNSDAISFHRNRIGSDRYHCRECGLLLDNRELLFHHLETIHTIEINAEESSQGYNEEDLDESMAKDHAPSTTLANFSENQYRLLVTDKDYDLIEFLWLRCCGCEELFERREDFEAHSKERHFPDRIERDEQNPYECSICFQRFSKKALLTFHRNKPNKRRIVCRVCEGIFKGGSAWQKHMGKCHKMFVEKADFEDGQPVSSVVEQMEVDECDVAEEDCKSDAYSIEGIEYIEESLTDCQDDPSDDDEEPKSNDGDDDDDEEESTHPKDSSKYISTRQRKQMALIPGNFVRVVAQYDGYNIVEIIKERCCSCLKFFDSIQELNEHTKEHRTKSLDEEYPQKKNSIIYECEYCLKKFDIAMIFVVHKRIREQKQFYQCRLCDFVIESESRLKNHMLFNDQHAKFYNLIREDVSDRYDAVTLPGFRCCGCGSYFEDESALVEHSKRDHPRDPSKDSVKRKHACSICDRRFSNVGEVTAHQQKQSSMVRYYCKLCDFESPSNARMLKHLYSSIHNESLPAIEVQQVEVRSRKLGSVRYCCFEECALPFHNFSQLQEHVQQHHQVEREANEAMAEAESDDTTGAVGRRWQCDCCGRVFRTGAVLKQHQFAHRVPKSFVCAVCGVAKSNKAALTVHEMKHTGERPHGCELCDKRFTSKTILNSHMKCHFPKQHQCPDCGEKFARGENLKRHIRHRHSEATFCCSYCPRKLKTREAQILHERSHTGEKPFDCRTDGCTKRYASITDRRRHEMASHTGERPHKCSFCAASFVRKRQLTIHERKHTGERPFACEQCGKGFIDAPLLKKHICS
ncbi:zinc finger protein 569 [Aedes aegypti]|uniref:Zinc finger protein n=1 Tax=Aedes aegypti TaxID=7159 RepID=A0A1S4FQE8_AEDAE|nr:zinc finger protein 569 [Aedes aegypti]